MSLSVADTVLVLGQDPETISNADEIFDNPILQSYLVKTNLTVNLPNLVDELTFTTNPTPRSGTITAIKYEKIIRGQNDLFKTKFGFKNACHLKMFRILENRKKKMVNIKLTSNGTFQVVGIPFIDIEKVVFKVFLLLEKLNKKGNIFKYVQTPPSEEVEPPKKKLNGTKEGPDLSYNTLNRSGQNRLEIVIVPILNNYLLTLTPAMTTKIFENSKLGIVQKFIDNKFLTFTVPNDPAITIKLGFEFEEFSNHPMKYITWNKKYGQIIRFIEYDSYTDLLKGHQRSSARFRKYLTFRLYSTGKVLISGFDEILIKKGVDTFLKVCEKF